MVGVAQCWHLDTDREGVAEAEEVRASRSVWRFKLVMIDKYAQSRRRNLEVLNIAEYRRDLQDLDQPSHLREMGGGRTRQETQLPELL